MTEEPGEMNRDAAGGVIALVVGFALGLLIAWIYWVEREQRPQPSTSAAEERVPLEPGLAASSEEQAARKEQEPDDLTRVEGIGPRISSVLRDTGIVTFEQLAESDPGTLKQMLYAEGLPFLDPGTWPEQATLAAAGAWEDLDALQRELSGGRRVG